MRRSGWLSVVGLLGLAGVGGCSALLGIEDGVPDDAIDGGGDATSDRASPANGDGAVTPNDSSIAPDGAKLDGAITPDTSIADVGVPDIVVSETSTFDACTGSTVDETVGVFVTASGADAPNCGTTRAAPCKTIQAGINTAKNVAGRTTVYVGAGTYVEQLTLAAGITVRGGWTVSGSTWSYDCSGTPQTLVVVQAPASASSAVLADALGGAATLSTLTIKTKLAADVQPGESLYGIFARGATTQLTLNDVVVSSAKAGDGSAGTQGGNGLAGTGTCAPGDGANNVTPGTIGAGAPAGTFGSDGYTAATGAVGNPGNTGDNGVVGGNGQCSKTDACAGKCMKALGSTSCSAVATTVCGTNGLSGCGGGGGQGGTGGTGGGASLALFVWDAQVTVNASSLTAGAGGQGASGGAGGPGAGGSAGVAGQDRPCATNCIASGLTCASTTGVTESGGAPGGAGGQGSQGGPGGGGAGGPSFAVFGNGASAIQLNGATLAHGAGGTSASNGTAGAAADKGP